MTATTATASSERRDGKRLYVWMSVYFIAVSAVGFAPTYWLTVPGGSFSGAPLVHLHAIIAAAWIILFFTQSLIAARGEIRNHRAWGMAGIGLGVAMVIVGFIAQTAMMERQIAQGLGIVAHRSSIMGNVGALLFGGLFAAAMLSISRPQAHKRLMLMATAVTMQAAWDRLFAYTVGFPPNESNALFVWLLTPTLITDLPIIVAIAIDWRTRSRPHPAYVAAGTIMLAIQLSRAPIAHTTAYYDFTEWLLRFAG